MTNTKDATVKQVKPKNFQCYSPKLNEFLRSKKIFPIKSGVHTTGVGVSKDEVIWDDFIDVQKAHESYPQIEVEEFKTLRDKSFTIGGPVSFKDLYVRKRVRYFKIYRPSDELQEALKEWKATGPSSKK